MRFFPIVDFQYAVLALFLGLGALVALVLAFRDYGSPDRREDAPRLEEYPENIRTGHGTISPLLIFVYVGFAIWALVYAILQGIVGPPF
jgi:hypothetical protein